MEMGGPDETDGLSPNAYGNSMMVTLPNWMAFLLTCWMLATTLWITASSSESEEEVEDDEHSDNEDTLR